MTIRAGALARSSGTTTSWPHSETASPILEPHSRKFMAGLPMNWATNMLRGRW